MSASTASYSSASHQPVNLPSLTFENFTKHQDFGKTQLPSQWGWHQYPPSPPNTHSPASPTSSAAQSFAGSVGSGYNSAAGFDRTSSTSFSDSVSTPFASNYSSSRNLPQPDQLVRHNQASIATSTAPSSAYFSSSSSARTQQLSRNNSDDGARSGAMQDASAKSQARKAKPHVQQACANCKKAHLACDVSRPCQRCVTNGKTETCRDVEHKKRGRPRLRDDRGQKIVQPHKFPANSTPLNLNPAAVRQHNHRYLAPAYPINGQFLDPQTGRRYTVDMTAADHKFGMPPPAPPPGCNVQSDAVALLDLDFKIQQCNEHFRSSFEQVRVDGARLDDLIAPGSDGTLKYFKGLILGEKQRRESSILPGLGNTESEIPDLRCIDFNSACSQFTSHEHPLSFRCWPGGSQELTITLRLAQVSLSYFVVLSVRGRDDFSNSNASTFYSQPSNSFSQPQTSYQQTTPQYGSGAYALASGPAPQSLDPYSQVSSMSSAQSPSYYDFPPSSFNASPLNVRTDHGHNFNNYMSQPNSSAVPRSSQPAMYYGNSYVHSGPASAPPAEQRFSYFPGDMSQQAPQPNYSIQSSDGSRHTMSSQQMNSLPPLASSNDTEDQRRKRRQLDIGGLVE